jgi:hypothetical protein
MDELTDGWIWALLIASNALHTWRLGRVVDRHSGEITNLRDEVRRLRRRLRRTPSPSRSAA